ncbi:hypothetical protein M9H77_19078 [Catharanthus roseus]|uniref:Uncharacterized protein n=1 Tax=Catharanthus roseus TaxID=4058 RepID=A0ACC0B997_CATRO|nr:hypothetical protein M9H77_19078 [Catharanthus roseus]
MLLHAMSFPFTYSTYFSVSSGTCPYPFTAYDNCDYFSATYRAVKHDKWPIAMQHEIDALEQNATWSLTILSPRKKALCYKWVCQIKLKSDGTVERLGLTSDTPKKCAQSKNGV